MRQLVQSFATSRPVAILMLFVAAGVFGFFSFGRLPLSLMPEMSYPTITVRTDYPGAAPEEVENDISRPIEESLGVIGGLRRLNSISRADISDVVLEFSWDTEMSDAIQDVMEQLDRVDLPIEASRPLILHYDPSLDPVMELSLAGVGPGYEGEAGLRRLRRLADLQLKRSLEPIRGIAAVRIKGGLEEEIHVRVEEEALRRTGLSIQTVIDRLAQENINVAGGTIKEGRTEFLVRTLNEYEDLDQIRDTIVARFDGRDVRIADLGQVVRSHKEREIVTRTDGDPSVQIEIYKEGDANIVSLAEAVTESIGETDVDRLDAYIASLQNAGDGEGGGGSDGINAGLTAQLYQAEGALLTISADRSRFIESSIDEVKFTALIGGALAILVLFLFLRNLVSTFIVGLSIPVSLLITFAPLNILEVSLNIMSLGGLALGIGMLVDSSIVVLESIHRCREEGDDIIPAAVRGTREVRSAVVASTLTSIAVFLPMVFVEGVAGQAFGDLGLAVVVSLLAATAVALFFIPMLASRRFLMEGAAASAGSGAAGTRSPWHHFGALDILRAWFRDVRGWRWILVPWAAFRFVVGMLVESVGKLLLFVAWLATWTARLAIVAFARTVKVLAYVPGKLTDALMSLLQGVYPKVLRAALAGPLVVVLAVLAIGWATWFLVRDMDSELLPEVHQSEFTVEVGLPVGTPLDETERILQPVEEAILSERESIDSLLVTFGYDSAQSQRSDEGEHTARFKVILEPSSDPAALEQAVVERLRGRFDGVPDLDARIVRPVLFSTKTPIEVEIHGDDLVRLRRFSDEVRSVMAAMPELADVQATLESGAPEVQILYVRERLSRYGLNIGAVARLVRDKVKGFEATRLNMKDRRVPIVVRLAGDDRETVDDVRRVVINPGAERPIPLSAVAEVSLGEGPSEVRRIDGRRVAVVRANLGQGSLSEASAAITNTLNREIDWPADMTFVLAGQQEEWDRSRASLWFALGLSVFLVYVIMAAQFESLVHPFVIMISIPLAFIGSVAALRVAGIGLSVVVFLGMIMLAGIVVNNAIVLVDYINQLRRRGVERTEAIVTAGQVRLRPILMTTATTVLGLTPMALGFGEGAELRTPMAIAVISGLISSTFLTLLIIPTFYAMADSAVSRLLGRGTHESHRLDESAAPLGPAGAEGVSR